MRLELYLRKHLTGRLKNLEAKRVAVKSSLQALNEIDFDNAEYTVTLTSRGENERETSVTHSHKGTIEDAVMAAESRFLSLNNRENMQAQYKVGIHIEGKSYSLPAKYWESFKKSDAS